ncbi:hypothetical protein ACXYMX_07340 [Sporosarcina sp. CAU 1771]
MKLRAVLLIAILVGGLYAIIQSHNEFKEKQFSELIDSKSTNFTSLSFTKPDKLGMAPEVWITEDNKVVENLLVFLENYSIQKLKTDEPTTHFSDNQFSILIESENGDEISILLEDNLIVLNSLSYYEIVNGPLNQNWMINFFISNQTHK